MLILSNDKSARAQFAALIEAIEKDVKDAEYKLAKCKPRSLAYAQLKGEIAAYNLTISLIISTDVWRESHITPTEDEYQSKISNVTKCSCEHTKFHHMQTVRLHPCIDCGCKMFTLPYKLAEWQPNTAQNG